MDTWARYGRLMRGWVAIVILFASVTAEARSDREEASRRHFEVGRALYQSERWREALVEFEAGRAADPRPEFDFNIARCLKKLGRVHEAAAALENYLRSRPEDPDAALLRGEIAELRAVPATTPRDSGGFARTPQGRAAIALGVLGGVSLLAAAATGGSALGLRGDYENGCARGACDAALYDRGHALAISTVVLIGVGVAAAITSIVHGGVRPRERKLAWNSF